jgi:hypothetical protein
VKTHLHLVLPSADVVIGERPSPDDPPWWEAAAFLALADVRRSMTGGVAPSIPARTPEESARHAVFWAMFEIEHIVRQLGKRVEAGEAVRLRSGVYAHAEGHVTFNLRIVQQIEVDAALTDAGGAR